MFLKIWTRVQVWHTCERHEGLDIDQQDIYLSFQDQCRLEIEVLKFLKGGARGNRGQTGEALQEEAVQRGPHGQAHV